jgi:glutamine synthetase
MVAAVAEAIGSSRLHKQILGDSPSKREILNRVQEEGVEFVDLQFTDVMGHVKSVTIPASIFEHVIDGGQWIDGSSIAGFTRIAESDMFLTADLSTFAVIPWTRGEHTTARVICWVHNPDGTPFPGDPRGVLLRQLERLAELGYSFKTGPELEFFLFEKTETKSRRCPTTARGTSTTPAIWPTPSARTW